MSTTELELSAGTGAESAEAQIENVSPEQQTAGDAHQQDGAKDDAHSLNGSDEADKGLTEEQRTIKRQLRRIERLTAKRGAAERETELLRQEVQELRRSAQGRGGEEGEEGETRSFTQADIDRVANQRADEIARQRAVGEKVGKTIKEGSKLEGFEQAVNSLAEVVPFMDKKGKATPFIEAVLDSDNAAQVLKHLGENPEEAEELAELSPLQLGRRLAKLEIQIAQGAKERTSKAPTPLRPVGGSSPAKPDFARMSDAEWRAHRLKRA